MFLTSYSLKKDIFYVVIQFALFAFYFMDPKWLDLDIPYWLRLVFMVCTGIGILIILLGVINLNENLTPFPTPKRNSNLISHGIYKYVRHPIYSGIIISLLSYAIVSQSGFRIAVAIALLLVFYFKSSYEEKKLIERFEDYTDYKDVTGRFIPKMKNRHYK